MNTRQYLFSAIVVALQVPLFVYGAGLVPCGGVDANGVAEPACQTCHVVNQVQLVGAWLVGVLSVAAAIMFIIAGFRIVTSGGNPSAMKAAKDMIINVAVGFIIVLSAWLLVDLFMKTLLGEDNAQIGPWNAMECVQQPEAGTVAGYLDLVAAPVAITETCLSIDDCAERAALCDSREDSQSNITNINGALQMECQFTSSYSGDNPPDLSAGGACDAALVAKYFPQQVGNAQCVIGGESTCGASLVSVTDTMRNDGGRAFSFGPTQVNITVHPVIGCGETLNCPDAFSGKNYDAVVINEDLYQKCAAALQNLDCGLTNSRRIFDDAERRHGNGWQPWSAAGSKGCKLHNFY